MNRLDLTFLTDADPEEALEAVLDAEQEAHEELGWYVPTREELMETTGDFFAHLMLEREYD